MTRPPWHKKYQAAGRNAHFIHFCGRQGRKTPLRHTLSQATFEPPVEVQERLMNIDSLIANKSSILLLEGR